VAGGVFELAVDPVHPLPAAEVEPEHPLAAHARGIDVDGRDEAPAGSGAELGRDLDVPDEALVPVVAREAAADGLELTTHRAIVHVEHVDVDHRFLADSEGEVTAEVIDVAAVADAGHGRRNVAARELEDRVLDGAVVPGGEVPLLVVPHGDDAVMRDAAVEILVAEQELVPEHHLLTAEPEGEVVAPELVEGDGGLVELRVAANVVEPARRGGVEGTEEKS